MFFSSTDITVEIVSAFDLEWEGRNDKPETRDVHAISLRLEGDAVFESETERLVAESGDIIFFPANFHYTLRSGKEHLLIVHFRSPDKLPEQFVRFHPKNIDYFAEKFDALYRTWSKKQFGYEYECKILFYKILLAIEKEMAKESLPTAADKITDAVEYIYEHFTDYELNIDRLARRCGMSDTYFRRLFVQQFGVTPLKFINRLRVTYATELLQSNYYTVAEISEKCGFNNINYFSLFFKKETGLPPSLWRAAQKK